MEQSLIPFTFFDFKVLKILPSHFEWLLIGLQTTLWTFQAFHSFTLLYNRHWLAILCRMQHTILLYALNYLGKMEHTGSKDLP
jgi:hypothetical protein